MKKLLFALIIALGAINAQAQKRLMPLAHTLVVQLLTLNTNTTLASATF